MKYMLTLEALKLARNEAKRSKNQCWNNYRIVQMSDSRDEVWYQSNGIHK